MAQDAAPSRSGPHRPIHTSWKELFTTASSRPGGLSFAWYRIGDPEDLEAPVVMRSVFPPGYRGEAHTHECDYTEIVLAGSQQVTHRWYHAGDIRIVRAGTTYGPLIAGPEGATVLLIFRDGRWPAVRPTPAHALAGA